MKNGNPRFTVFTPCYNSAAFIHRVFDSLRLQTFRDFEWFVINDASSDDTHTLIENFIQTVDFPVQYFNLSVNQGVHNNINKVIKEAAGDFLVLYGHDDEMTPDALEVFNMVLDKYDDPSIASVYALARDQNGNLVGKKYPKDELVSDYWTQFFSLNNEAEKFQCFRTVYLREFYPFNTDPVHGQPSSWLWGKVGKKYRSVFINKVLRIYHTNITDSITYSFKRKKAPHKIYNYYLCWVNEFQYYIKDNRLRRLRGIAGYVSYGLLCGKSFGELLRPVQKPVNKIWVFFFYFFARVYNRVR